MAVDFTIDFDPGKSITLKQPDKKPCEDYQFKLLPALRIIDTEVASARTIESGCKAPKKTGFGRIFMPVYVSPPVSGRAWSWHQTGCRHEPVAALVQRVPSAPRTVHRLPAARVQQ